MVNKKYKFLFLFVAIFAVIILASMVLGWPTCTSWIDHQNCGPISHCTGAYEDLCSLDSGCCLNNLINPPHTGTWYDPVAWGCSPGAIVTFSGCHKYEKTSSDYCCTTYCNGKEVGPDMCGPPASACKPSSACAKNTCIGQTCSNGCGGKVKGTKVCNVKKLSNVYWADMNGNKIDYADFKDTVELIMTNRTSGNFSIKENGSSSVSEIKKMGGNHNNNKFIGMWTISKEDLDKAKDFSKFYFTTDDNQTSEYLSINTTEDDDPMNITLISPKCGSYFDKNTGFVINVSANDADDFIDGTVEINGQDVKTFHNGGIVFSESSLSGNVRVVVEANNTRGERSRISSNIMILDKENGKYVDGKYVAACIVSPKDMSNIEGNIVNFDASTTRAIKIKNGIINIISPDNGGIFSWYWRFMPGDITRNFVNTNKSIAYKFTADFPVPGDNSASLTVEVK